MFPFTCRLSKWCGVNTRLVKSSDININTNKTSQLSYSLSLSKIRYFSTNEGNNSTNKLVINSSTESIIFDNGQAVLMLPLLKAFLELEDDTNQGVKFTESDFKEYFPVSKKFHISLLNIMCNLECDFYKFEGYFYINDMKNVLNGLSLVYTIDPFNKDCLNLLWDTIGYTKFSIILENLKEKKPDDISRIYSEMCYLITERLKEILENEVSKSTSDLNKDTLLIITKSSKKEYDEGVDGT